MLQGLKCEPNEGPQTLVCDIRHILMISKYEDDGTPEARALSTLIFAPSWLACC